MKQIKFFVIIFILPFACTADKSAPSSSEAPPPTESISDQSNDQFCFEKKYKNGKLNIHFTVEDDHISGNLKLKSKGGENIEGRVSGSFYSEEYVLDFNYVVNGQQHMEKIIFEYDQQSARLARSGSVTIEGKRHERNNGQSTLDVLERIDCK